jgi:hypothetical protein
MFGHRYFAATYFPDRYFPVPGVALTEAPYFFHGVFPARYFADRYFPGRFPVGTTPPPPSPLNVGVWQRPERLRRRPSHLKIDAELPVLVARLRATIAPIDIGVAVRALVLPEPEFTASLSISPVDVGMSMALALRCTAGDLQFSIAPPVRPRSTAPNRLEEDEENDLLESWRS